MAFCHHDVLFHRATLFEERDEPGGGTRQVGHYEPDLRIHLARMPSGLGEAYQGLLQVTIW
jgi:hypothetical protein